MRLYEETMKMMRLTAGDSKEETYKYAVYVDELWWIEHDWKGKVFKEIVSASFYIKDTEIAKMKRLGTWLKLESFEQEEESFIAYDFNEEFNIDDSIKTQDGTRVLLTRSSEAVINIDEKKEIKNNSKLSHPYPITFLQKEHIDKCLEETYDKIYEKVTTPMVPNMKQPLILAGHINAEFNEARAIIETIEGIASHNVDKKKMELAKYFINIYKSWVLEITDHMLDAGYIKPINVYVSQVDAKPHHIIINREFIKNLISKLVKQGILWFSKDPTYDEVKDYNDFMYKMATFMTTRIESIAEPIHIKGDIRQDTLDSLETDFDRPYKDAQKNAIEACMKAIEKQKLASIVGEMGVGSAERSTITLAG